MAHYSSSPAAHKDLPLLPNPNRQPSPSSCLAPPDRRHGHSVPRRSPTPPQARPPALPALLAIPVAMDAEARPLQVARHPSRHGRGLRGGAGSPRRRHPRSHGHGPRRGVAMLSPSRGRHLPVPLAFIVAAVPWSPPLRPSPTSSSQRLSPCPPPSFVSGSARPCRAAGPTQVRVVPCLGRGGDTQCRHGTAQLADRAYSCRAR
jgi:hypothetical protein